MTPSPVPQNEADRQQALDSTGLLESGAVAVLDDIVALAAQICRVPVALVSLVDCDRQYFKARLGLELAETPRNISFCAHVVDSGEPMVVEDTALDPRFADNPLVTGPPHVRFYAGVPLVVEPRHAIGTLCIVDTQPRSFGPAERESLARLGRIAVLHIEQFRQRRAGPVHRGT
jgi:GAF domain-containing protein